MHVKPLLTDEMLAGIPPRKRAVLKLRTGCSALAEEELLRVRPELRMDAMTIKARSLRQVGDLLGVSKERIRQIEDRALAMLGIRPEEQQKVSSEVSPGE